MTAVGAILKIYISQGSVATRLRCGRIFNGSFIANFLHIVAVKEFLKSVNIWRRYELEYGVSLFFDSRCICAIYRIMKSSEMNSLSYSEIQKNS